MAFVDGEFQCAGKSYEIEVDNGTNFEGSFQIVANEKMINDFENTSMPGTIVVDGIHYNVRISFLDGNIFNATRE